MTFTASISSPVGRRGPVQRWGHPLPAPVFAPPPRRFLDRYPVLCLLASCTAGLALVIAALAWILSHDGCSRPIGAVVAVLLLAVSGVCAFAPLLMLAASDAPWLFPEDSERE
ncbi:hypothetical protein LMG11582_0797 [Bifidobacterium bifidum]|nr:hypothetical protein LMG11582_0797 [Bifidobacterium bifidum]